MRDLTKELNWRLGIIVLEFAICRTHAAQRLNLARSTFRRTCALLRAGCLQRLVPSFGEAAIAHVVFAALRNHADVDMPVRVNGAGPQASTTKVKIVTRWRRADGKIDIEQAPVLGFSRRIDQVHGDN